MGVIAIDTVAADAGRDVCRVVLASTASTMRDGARRVPPFIPASQRYYWTSLWQRDELASLEDIKNRDVRRFADPLDAARWLLSDED